MKSEMVIVCYLHSNSSHAIMKYMDVSAYVCFLPGCCRHIDNINTQYLLVKCLTPL